MRATKISQPFAAFVLFFALLSGCSWIEGRESGGEYMDDAAISTRIRGSILADPITKLTQIDVETMKGTVQLSGFVDSAAAKARAEELARNQTGVRALRNNIVIRPSTGGSPSGGGR